MNMDYFVKNDPQILLPAPVPATPDESNYASEFYRRILEMIHHFEEKLNHDEEVGVRLVSFGQTVQFHVEDLSYYNPSLISFVGKLNTGARVELIQNVNQISFLLMALPKFNEEEPAKRLGFILD